MKRIAIFILLLMATVSSAVATEPGVSLAIPATESLFKLDSAGDDEYDLRFTNINGLNYNIEFIDNDPTTGYRIGDEDDDLHWIEGESKDDYYIAQDSQFIVSSRKTTHVLEYQRFDTDEAEATFTDLAGKTIDVIAESEGGHWVGELEVGQRSYTFYVKDEPGYPISVDLNGDGDVDGDQVHIYTKAGHLDLGLCDAKNRPFKGCSESSGEKAFEVTFITTQGDLYITMLGREKATVGLDFGGEQDMRLKEEKQDTENIYYFNDEYLIHYHTPQDVNEAEDLEVRYGDIWGELEEKSTPEENLKKALERAYPENAVACDQDQYTSCTGTAQVCGYHGLRGETYTNACSACSDDVDYYVPGSCETGEVSGTTIVYFNLDISTGYAESLMESVGLEFVRWLDDHPELNRAVVRYTGMSEQEAIEALTALDEVDTAGRISHEELRRRLGLEEESKDDNSEDLKALREDLQEIKDDVKSVKEDTKETKGLLQSIFDWLKSLFN